VAGSCEYGNEPSNSITYWKFLEGLSDCLFLKDLAPRSLLASYLASLFVFGKLVSWLVF
jgi:hypothetical protein